MGFIVSVFGKNWRTTMAAAVAAVAGFVATDPTDFARYAVLFALCKYVHLGGFVALGIAAKDASATKPAPGAQDDKLQG